MVNHEVALLPGWLVMAVPFCPVARYSVTEMVDRGWTGKFKGSDTARAPLGMVMPGFPPLNVTVWSVEGWIALTPEDPLKGRATVMAVMGRSVRPKALEIRILICSAPVDMCNV
jgi:hypothetical protein